MKLLSNRAGGVKSIELAAGSTKKNMHIKVEKFSLLKFPLILKIFSSRPRVLTMSFLLTILSSEHTGKVAFSLFSFLKLSREVLLQINARQLLLRTAHYSTRELKPFPR